MAYPYGMQGAPAVGNGLGGLPRRTAVAAAAVARLSAIPFRVVNTVDITVPAATTYSYPLGFVVNDFRCVTVKVMMATTNYSNTMVTPLELFLGGSNATFNPYIRIGGHATPLDIQLGVSTANNLVVSNQDSMPACIVRVTEYAFTYESFENITGLTATVNNASYTLANPISDPSRALLVAYDSTTGQERKGSGQVFVGAYSAIPQIGLISSGSTGFSANLFDANTIKYSTFSEVPGSTTYRAFIYGGLRAT